MEKHPQKSALELHYTVSDVDLEVDLEVDALKLDLRGLFIASKCLGIK